MLRCLGSGGMGKVYEARDREQGTRVALKVLGYDDAHLIYRFKREFRALQNLQHRNLVSLGELFEHGGRWFFTMELVDGCELAEFRATADEAALRGALRQLAEGLAFLHDAGKIHRDVKPSNVLVEPGGRVVLLDFGLIAETDPLLQSVVTYPVGTPAYMAPEQAAGARVGAAADWYAVGAILYEALTGVLPFEGTNLEMLVAKQSGLPRRPRELVPEVASDLDDLCMRLLAPQPESRPDAAAILAALGGQPGARPPSHDTATRAEVFVGRDVELGALRDALAGVDTAGDAAIVVIEGDSGLGKSTLVERFVDELRDSRDDVLCFHGRCYDSESVNYRALDAVVDAIVRHLWTLAPEEVAPLVPRHARYLARMFPVLDGVEAFANAPHAARSRERTTDYDGRQYAFRALRELLARLAQRWRLVISIDDAQWADGDSLLLLGELFRPPDAPPALVVAAARPIPDDGRAAAAWTRFRARAGRSLRVVRLQPLASDLSESLATTLLAHAGARRDVNAADIAREAGGHPLHIAELVHHATTASQEPHRPLRLDEAIVDRVRRLPDAAQRVAELIALAGAPLRIRTLRRALDVSPGEFDRALTTLRVARVARRAGDAEQDLVECYHDRVRESLAASLAAPARRALHDRLAAAMLAANEPAEALVRHLAGAGRNERAAENAVEAAQRASDAMAYDRAADLYRTALRLGAYTPAQARALRISLGEALIAAGRGREAAQAFTEAADGAEPAVRLECRRHAAEQLLITGYIDEGLAAIAALLGEIDTPLPATPRRALMSLLRNRAALALGGLRWTVRREGQVPRETLTRLDVLRVVSHGLSMVDTIRGADFNSRYLRLALRTGEPVRLCRALGIEAVFVGSQGGRGLRRARRLNSRIELLADTEGDAYARAYSVGIDGTLGYFEGTFERSAQRLTECETLFRRVRVLEGYERNNVRMFRAFSMVQSGAFGELRPLLGGWIADAEQRGDRYLETTLRRACAIMWVAHGDLDGLRDSLARARWRPPDGQYHLQHWFEVLARSELALHEGTAEELVELVDEGVRRLDDALLLRIQMVRCEARWTQARIHLAAAGTDDARRAAFELAMRAVRRLRREPFTHAVQVSALLEACAHASTGDVDRAAAALRRTIDGPSGETGMYAAIARLRLAELLGGAAGEALAAEADKWRASVGLARLEPLAAAYAPCFQGLSRRAVTVVARRHPSSTPRLVPAE